MSLHKTEVHALKPDAVHDQVMVHHRYTMSQMGAFALDLARSMAIAGVPLNKYKCDQRMRLLSEDEVVSRAVTITKLVFSAIDGEGWVTDVPSFKTLLRESNKTGFR